MALRLGINLGLSRGLAGEAGEPIPGGTISPTSITVKEGAAFSQQFTASGGTGPYTWSITSGSLPGGLSLSADTISGTPSGAEGDPYSFTIRATDSLGDYIDQAISGTVQAAGAAIADVFLADAYTGNGSTQTRTTGWPVDLAILKRRDSAADWGWFDSARGATKLLSSNSAAAETTDADTLTAFGATGIDLGADVKFNASGAANMAYLFKRQAGFMDVVSYTGNGVAGRTVAHTLGEAPGMIFVKGVSVSNSWCVYHAELSASDSSGVALFLDFPTGATDSPAYWNDTPPTLTDFTCGSAGNVNASGASYIAYLFANNDLIKCGHYIGNGSAVGPTVTLDFEPQFVMIRRADVAADWWIYDSARSASNPRTNKLLWNSSAAEDTAGEDVDFLASGFQPKTTATGINASGGRYVYMAVTAP